MVQLMDSDSDISRLLAGVLVPLPVSVTSLKSHVSLFEKS